MENRVGNVAVVRWLSNALFPAFCVQCESEGHVLCPRCRLYWMAEPILERFSRQTRSVHGVFSMSPYPDAVVKGLLRRWKYHGEEKAGEMLMTLLEETLQTYDQVLPAVDAVAFVPLHRVRRNERGFDQAEHVANTVSHVLKRPLVPVLARVKKTTQQAKLADDERARAIDASAFQFRREIAAIPAKVLLVDDVWTTGTTLRAAAQVLRQAGVQEVWAFTLARG